MVDNGNYYNYLVSCGFAEKEIEQKLKEREIMARLYFEGKKESREITSHAYENSMRKMRRDVENFLWK